MGIIAGLLFVFLLGLGTGWMLANIRWSENVYDMPDRYIRYNRHSYKVFKDYDIPGFDDLTD